MGKTFGTLVKEHSSFNMSGASATFECVLASISVPKNGTRSSSNAGQ